MKKNTIKGYNIDVEKNTIILTKAFAAKAFTPGTAEFRILSALVKAYPNFEIVKRTIVNKKENKEKHEGLNLDLMNNYIVNFVKGEKAIKEFEAVKAYYKNTKGYYGKVKSWFLKKYPNYQEVDFAAMISNEIEEELISSKATAVAEMISRNNEVSTANIGAC